MEVFLVWHFLHRSVPFLFFCVLPLWIPVSFPVFIYITLYLCTRVTIILPRRRRPRSQAVHIFDGIWNGSAVFCEDLFVHSWKASCLSPPPPLGTDFHPIQRWQLSELFPGWLGQSHTFRVLFWDKTFMVCLCTLHQSQGPCPPSCLCSPC